MWLGYVFVGVEIEVDVVGFFDYGVCCILGV